jgi:Rad3-related DNA helicase
VFLALASGATFVIAKHDKKILEKNNKEAKQEQIITQQKEIMTKIDSFGIQLLEIKFDQRQTKEDINSLAGTVGVIKTQLGKHIINTATKDDILNWMNAFESKKNNSIRPIAQTQRK